MERGIQKVVAIRRLHDRQSSYEYWKLRSYLERLEAIEELRRQYIEFMGYADRRVQRACRIVKLKQVSDEP
jgi:hypothetical protein